MSELSENNKAAITAWTLVYMCVDKPSMWASDHFHEEETTHSQRNTTAMPYKNDDTVSSCGRRAGKGPLWAENWMSNYIWQTELFFNSFLLHRFLIPASKLTIGACGQFLAVDDTGWCCMHMPCDCKDIFSVTHFGSEGNYFPFLGVGGEEARGEWWGSNHTERPSGSANFKRQGLLGEWKTQLKSS